MPNTKPAVNRHNSPPPAMEIHTAIETITPQKAREYLGLNQNNRRTDAEAVTRYAEYMRRGDWSLTGDPIRFDQHGTLIDGQHRLRACSAANVPFETIVIRGVDHDSRSKIDIGRGRTPGDWLTMQGVPNAVAVAACVKVLMRHALLVKGESIPGLSRKPAPHQVDRFVALNPDVIEAVKVGRRLAKGSPVFSAACVSAFFWMAGADQSETAHSFLASAASGASLTHGDPVMAIRSYFINAKMSRKHVRSQDYIDALVKAWDYRIQGKSLKIYRPINAKPSRPSGGRIASAVW